MAHQAETLDRSPVDHSAPAPASTEPLRVTEIVTEAGALPLREALEVVPNISPDLVVFEYPPLGIIVYGPTREEAEAEFHEELSWLWGAYALAPDERLDRGARNLKETLLAMVPEGAA